MTSRTVTTAKMPRASRSSGIGIDLEHEDAFDRWYGDEHVLNELRSLDSDGHDVIGRPAAHGPF